jgi:hypothetical protein
MEIYINLEKLEELHLTPSLYSYLYCLYYQLPYNLAGDALKAGMNAKLEQLGYLKRTSNGLVIREKTRKLFAIGTPTNNSVNEWIDEWRQIFPKGVKSGNRPVRGDKQGVLKKMQSFVKANPKITKEQIFEATTQYVFEASLKNYQYMICADYFINKSGSSVLGALIEDIAEKGTSSLNRTNGSSWHKEI